MAINPVAVQFTGDAKAFFAEMAKVRKDMGALTQEVSAVSRASASLQKNITRGLAGFASFATLRSMIRETAAAQAGVAQLDAALRSTGEAAGWSRTQLLDMARDFSRSSTFGQTEIVAATTRLLTYSGIVGDKVPEAMQMVLDQSARLGTGLSQNAEIIGRALENPSRGVAALSEQGFVFTEQQRKMLKALEDAGRTAEAQAIVLDVLRESYDGAAAAARDTFGGAMASVQNAVKDLMSGGDGGLDSATEGINALADALRSPEIQEGFALIISGLSSVIGLAAKAAAGVAGFAKSLGENVAIMIQGRLDPAFQTIQELEPFLKELEQRRQRYLDGWDDLDKAGQAVARVQLQKIEADIKAYQSAITELKAATAAATGGAAAAAGPTDPPADNPPTSEFLKVEEQLVRQIALFGKTGEAARVAYEIQAGALRELSAAEQRRVIGLAQQLDGLAAQKVAMEEFAKLQLDIASSADKMAADALAQILRDGESYAQQQQDLEYQRLEMRGETIAQEIAAERALVDAKLAMEQELQGKILSLRQGAVNSGIGLLTLFAQRSKTAAKALILVNRGIAIAQAVQNTAAAVTKALAIYGPTPQGIAAAGTAKAIGAVQIGLIAATGIAELNAVGAGNGASVVGPGTPNNPIFTQSGEDQQYGVSQQSSVQVIVTGTVYGMDDFQDRVVDAVGQAVNGRDVVFIKPGSRQAMEIRQPI